MNHLQINNQIIEYEMHKSNKAKRLCFSVRNSKLKVAVPRGITYEHARKYIEENGHIIVKKLDLLKILHNPSYQFVDGEKFYYRGRYYSLKIIGVNHLKGYTSFKGSQLYVFLPDHILPENHASHTRSLLKEWYINQAQKTIPDMVDFYAKMMNLSYEKIKIRDQKTRWGSCSAKKNINLNWRIIMAPNQVAAYVIIHELSHLRSMNHSGAFWKEVRTYMPEYEKWKLWLRENGHHLMRI